MGALIQEMFGLARRHGPKLRRPKPWRKSAEERREARALERAWLATDPVGATARTAMILLGYFGMLTFSALLWVFRDTALPAYRNSMVGGFLIGVLINLARGAAPFVMMHEVLREDWIVEGYALRAAKAMEVGSSSKTTISAPVSVDKSIDREREEVHGLPDPRHADLPVISRSQDRARRQPAVAVSRPLMTRHARTRLSSQTLAVWPTSRGRAEQ